tara:strand:+ start:133 stop:438 length:306 start_codon:yes stop_codon:yes gene_type:complete
MLEQTIQMYDVGQSPSETRALSSYGVSNGLYELLSGDCGGGKAKVDIPLVIFTGDKLEKGDVHDTYKVDRFGNLYGGHTTARVKGGKSKKLDYLDDIDTQK